MSAFPLALLAAWQWHPRLAPVGCGLLTLAAAAWLVWLWRRLDQGRPGRRVAKLWAPKLVAAFMLLLAVFDPVSALQKSEAVAGRVLVLVDTSESMAVVDDRRLSRLARAEALLEGWTRAAADRLRLDRLDFDTRLRPAGTRSGDGPRGTDLGHVLQALGARGDLAGYAGAVLLTDGGDEPLELTAPPNLPFWCVGIGTDDAGWNDVAVEDVQAPATAETGVDFEVGVTLQARAGDGGGFRAALSAVRVRLERAATNGWQVVAERPADLNGLRAAVRLPAGRPEAGIQRYRVVIPALPGEISPLNNQRVFSVQVRKQALRVLYFTAELGQEFKVLRSELGRDPGVGFTALFRTASDQYTLQGDRRPGEEALGAGLPGTVRGLVGFDLVILGSFPARALSPGQIEALRQFVDQGGALVFLGGESSFGRGGYSGSALAPLFPWSISERETEPERAPCVVQIPPTGAGHPLLATLEERLVQGNATVDSVNRVGDLKPGATLLLAARLGDRLAPLVAEQRYGRGRVLGIASNTLWKWATQPDPLRAAYGVFWRQAARYLTDRLEGSSELTVRWDRDAYRPGETARAEIRTTRSGPAMLRFAATLAHGTRTAPVEVSPLAGVPGAFEATVRFQERGEYVLRLVATTGDRVVDTYEKVFPVAALLPEGARIEVNETLLQALATRSGGAWFREADAAQLAERLLAKTTRRVVVEESSLIEAGPWFALALATVLGLEWTLRRRAGLF